MALIKVDPILRVNVWPRGYIRRMTAAPYALTDIFAGRIGEGQQDFSDTPSGDPQADFSSAAWLRQYGFKSVSPYLDFLTFYADSTARFGASGLNSGGVGGFLLKPREIPVNAVIGTDYDIDLPDDLELMVCEAKGGSWSERVPDSRPRRSGIYLQTQLPNEAASAQTAEWAPNEGQAYRIQWIGVAEEHTTDAGFRLIMPGGRYSLLWRESRAKRDAKPEACRWGYGVDGNGAVVLGWQTWHRLIDAAPVSFTGTSKVTSQIIGGRWVFSIDGKFWHLADSDSATELGNGEVRKTEWPAGVVKFNAFGVMPHIEIARLSYLKDDTQDPEGGPQRHGSLIREQGDVPPRSSYSHIGASLRGYKAPGTEMQLDVTADPAERRISYAVTLWADPDGITTPLATSAGVQFPAEFVQDDVDPIDLRPYITDWSFESAEPGVIGACDFSCTINRTRLTNKVASWETKVQQFSPVTVELGWRYRDGNTGVESDGDLEMLLSGYILNPDRDLKDYLGFGMPLVCRDEILRVQEPAGFVDERFAPLDALLDEGNGADVYGGDCIKHLLRLQFGDEFANGINGTGNARAFFPESHYPLLSRGNSQYFVDNKPLDSSGFALAPPFGDSLSSWFQTLAGYDYAVLYWGKSPLNPTGPPCLIYGRTRQITAAWQTVQGDEPVQLPDAIYGDGQVGHNGRLVGGASVQFRSEKAYNDFVAWSSGEQGNSLKPLAPGLDATMGRALLPFTDANAADYSWRRTLLVREEYLEKQPGIAQNLAARVEAEFEGVDVFTATLMLPRGDETLHWGRTVRPRLESDPTGKLNGQILRVIRVAHRGSFENGSDALSRFTTELTVRPLSGTGY